MNAQEELWFERPTWNHERGTTKVIIVFNQKAPVSTVWKIITDYMVSIGFRSKQDLSRIDAGKRHRKYHLNFLVDLVEKEFDIISQGEIRALRHEQSLETAVPSQLLPYLQNNKGMLTGKKFGL